MLEDVQQIKALANRIECLYCADLSAADADLMQALVDLGDHAETIIKLCIQYENNQ